MAGRKRGGNVLHFLGFVGFFGRIELAVEHGCRRGLLRAVIAPALGTGDAHQHQQYAGGQHIAILAPPILDGRYLFLFL